MIPRLFATLIGCAGLWILFVAGVKPQEMIVGAISIGLTAAFTGYVGHRSTLNLRFRMRDVMQAWRLPLYLISGSWEILRVLVLDLLHIRPAESLYRAASYEQQQSAVAAARRVLAIGYTTATPNFIIIGIDSECSQRMLFHQLSRSEVLTMTRNLGAQA